MRVRDENGYPARIHLEAAAKKGHPGAIKDLQGPPIPDELWYLFEWMLELDGARQYDMNGPQPVGYKELDAWARLTDRQPEPHEVRALLLLDRVLLHPKPVESRAS